MLLEGPRPGWGNVGVAPVRPSSHQLWLRGPQGECEPVLPEFLVKIRNSQVSHILVEILQIFKC